jgi:hypothetical protein
VCGKFTAIDTTKAFAPRFLSGFAQSIAQPLTKTSTRRGPERHSGHVDQEKATAERMGAKILTLQTSHVAMLAQPEKVAAFMIEAAESLSKTPLPKVARDNAKIGTPRWSAPRLNVAASSWIF